MSSDISRILQRGETETSEFKGARAPLDALAKAVCGMLNQRGGVLVWGVDDQGQPIGLDRAEERSKELNDFLIRHLNPRPLFSVSAVPVAKKNVVIVDVPPGADKPYSLNREIWVRLGRRTLKADEDGSANIVERSAAQLDRWEREPMPGFGLKDCDADEFLRARTEIAQAGRFGIDVPSSDEELLRRLYLEKNGQLTNAAVVLFARQPRVWAPNLAVRVTSYSQDSKEAIGNDAMMEGPAIRILKDLVVMVQQRTGFSGRFDREKLERQDRPVYALFALREGLVNAMVHRDYTAIGGHVQIEVFPDRLTIRNPGQLPDGWTIDDLAKKHESHPANPDIARVFYLRGLMEQLGMGTQRLIAACKELDSRPPIWSTERGTVSLTLFAAPISETEGQLTDRQERFLGITKAGDEFKVSDYVDAVKVSERQARRDLTELENLGLVKRHGRGPATSYRRTNREADPAKSGHTNK